MKFIKKVDIVLVIELIFLFISLSFPFVGDIYCKFYFDCIKPGIDLDFSVVDEEYNIYSEIVLSNDQKKYVSEQVANIIEQCPAYENNYCILITDLVTDGRGNTGNYIGRAAKIKKIIYLKYNSIDDALYHEIGHTVDYQHGFSKTDSFLELYNQVEHNTYHTSNHKEYFAENYELYVREKLQPGSLYDYYAELFPKTND